MVLPRPSCSPRPSTNRYRCSGTSSSSMPVWPGLPTVAVGRLLTALSLAYSPPFISGCGSTRFLDASHIGIALGVFLVFPLLAFAGLLLARVQRSDRLKGSSRRPPWSQRCCLCSLPPTWPCSPRIWSAIRTAVYLSVPCCLRVGCNRDVARATGSAAKSAPSRR